MLETLRFRAICSITRIDNNLYFNGPDVIPEDSFETVNYTDDTSRILADPLLPENDSLVIPRWTETISRVADGSLTIREAFDRMVGLYAIPAAGSPVVGAADPSNSPSDDILGNLRLTGDYDCDMGAYQKTTDDSCDGDFDTDGDVDGSDLAVFAADFGKTDCSGDCAGDFNGDGDVDGSDLAIFAADFGRTDCP